MNKLCSKCGLESVSIKNGVCWLCEGKDHKHCKTCSAKLVTKTEINNHICTPCKTAQIKARAEYNKNKTRVMLNRTDTDLISELSILIENRGVESFAKALLNKKIDAEHFARIMKKIYMLANKSTL